MLYVAEINLTQIVNCSIMEHRDSTLLKWSSPHSSKKRRHKEAVENEEAMEKVS